MTVYIDNMNAKFGRMTMCHMVADTDDELRDMDTKIGVQQRWHQGDHFDICLSKKEKALQLGAIEITWHQMGIMSLRRRRTGQLGTPSDAEQWKKECLNKT